MQLGRFGHQNSLTIEVKEKVHKAYAVQTFMEIGLQYSTCVTVFSQEHFRILIQRFGCDIS